MIRKKKRRQAPLAAALAALGVVAAAAAALGPRLVRRFRGGSAPHVAPTLAEETETAQTTSQASGAVEVPTGDAAAEETSAPGPSPATSAPAEDTATDTTPTPASAGPIPTPSTAAQAVEHEWRCESCGQAFRISGEGRHRIYWLPDAAPGDPVIDGRCPTCGTPLPGERPQG